MSEKEVKVWHIETHESIKGKINVQTGKQAWPQVYENDLGNTLPVVLRSAYEQKCKELENLKMVCRRLSAAKTIESRDKIKDQCLDLFRGSVLRDQALNQKESEE